MKSTLRIAAWLMAAVIPCVAGAAEFDEADPAYYHTGELAGSLRTADPLPIYAADPQHLWNRLFAAISIRPSHLPSKKDGEPIDRIEGGDVIDFLGWSGTTYWDAPETAAKLEGLLDEFLAQHAEKLSASPLHSVLLQRDLWAAFDFLMGQNIERRGDLPTRQRRTRVCRKLARVIQSLALPAKALAELPDNYALALASGHFSTKHDFDPSRNYLPPKLLTNDDEWQELDFYKAKRSEDIERRWVFLHMRHYRGRSYFRVFYRFPQGRTQLEDFLKRLDATGIDWRTGAQNGHVMLKPDAPQVPVGTEVVLLQFLIALDTNLQPVPTSLVESVRVIAFKNVEGDQDPSTNSNHGINFAKYTLKRRLALAGGMKNGGLHREPDDLPFYRILFEGEKAPDWGSRGRTVTLVNDCRSCHSGRGQSGVFSLPSLVNSASSDTGAPLGLSQPLPLGTPSPHPARTVKWKTADETYRRLVEFLEE